MARTVTLASLQNRVLWRANMEGTTFITTEELTHYINSGIAELYDIVLTSYGDEYYDSTQTVTTTSGTAAYALASDFYKLNYVDATINGRTINLSKYNKEERNLFLTGTGWSTLDPIYYRLTGGTTTSSGSITFIPTPAGAYTVTLHYTPAPPRLADPTESYDGIAGWDDYVEICAAIKCLQKEESDVSILMEEKQRLMTRIQGAAPARDLSGPERIHDVTFDEFRADWPWWRNI